MTIFNPFRGKADRSVPGVDRRPGADGRAVLLIDDLVLAPVVELMHDDLSRL
jgi:hypothetical protein